jgi:hypothetical protein
LTLLYETYSLGSKKRMRAVKKRFATPTIILTMINTKAGGTSVEGQTLPAGTALRIVGTLYTSSYAFVPSGKPIKIYVMLPGSTSWTLLATVNTVEPSNFLYVYTLGVGNYKFYCQFEGDSEYTGCP